MPPWEDDSCVSLERVAIQKHSGEVIDTGSAKDSYSRSKLGLILFIWEIGAKPDNKTRSPVFSIDQAGLMQEKTS